jgi:hypothetical protein
MPDAEAIFNKPYAPDLMEDADKAIAPIEAKGSASIIYLSRETGKTDGLIEWIGRSNGFGLNC